MAAIGSLGTLLPLGVHRLGGRRSASVLGEWKAWTSVHCGAITTVLVVVLGTGYAGDAIASLT